MNKDTICILANLLFNGPRPRVPLLQKRGRQGLAITRKAPL